MAPPPVPLAAEFPVHRPSATRWADNDQYGHLNNVVYYELFDSAVNGWLMDATGCDIRSLPAIGVVAETSCRYLRELSFPEMVSTGLRLEHRGRSSVIYELAVFKQVDGRPENPACAVGRFVHVYVDAESRTPVPVPDEIARALDSLEAKP